MIELKNVSSGYGKRQVLCDLCAEFKIGKLTSLIGVNGCGKSTLLKTVIGVLPLNGGAVTVDGVDLSRLKDKERARRIAYLAQGRADPEMTVGEMVLQGRFPHTTYPRGYSAEDKRIALEAMERLRISELRDTLVSALSGGIKQKAYISMALAQQADHILLDEPTTFLDISHQLELMRLLRGIADSGHGVVVVMHDLPMALSFSDEIAVMRDGRIIMKATPAEVCSSGIIKEIFGVSVSFDRTGQCYRYDL